MAKKGRYYTPKGINYHPLIDYLRGRNILPEEAIDIIHSSTPEGQEANRKFNWKMMRFTLYLWQRVEEEKSKNLNSKTESAMLTASKKNYRDLYAGYHDGKRMDVKKEAKNLFKLVTDPRQKPYFKSRYFMYEGKKLGQKAHIPQEHIDHLMQWPKKSS
jgi:lipoprotein NlpI